MTLLDPAPHNDPGRKKTLNLYAAFGAALVFSCIPTLAAALLSLVFMIGVLIAGYVLRSGSEDDSLAENHAVFVIRTIWIGSALAVVTMAAGSFYMFQTIDDTVLIACAENYINNAGPSVNLSAIERELHPCIEDFIQLNIRPLSMSAVIVIAPILLYFAVRFIRGLSRALKGYRLANPKGWL